MLSVSLRKASDSERAYYCPEFVAPPRETRIPDRITHAAEALIRRFADFAHYTDEKHIRDFAGKNMATLLAQREQILGEWEKFHKDRAIIALLEKTSPVTYERARFKVRALAIAEQIAADPVAVSTAVARKETPEEYAARQARHELHKGEVEMARTMARLVVEKRAEEQIAREFPTLDDDERRQKVRAIVEDAYEKADTNATRL
jgi:hypothetical protein